MVLGLLGGRVLLRRCSGRVNFQNQVQHFTDLIYFLRSTRVRIPSTHNAYIYLDLSFLILHECTLTLAASSAYSTTTTLTLLVFIFSIVAHFYHRIRNLL